MRSLTVVLVTVLALLRQCAHAPGDHAALSTEAFRDFIGVNTHLQYSRSPYADIGRDERALQYVGIRHLRDSAFRAGEGAFDHYLALARAGRRFDLFVNADMGEQLARVVRLLQASPGAVDLLEGPNEVNNDPVVWRGVRGDAGARAYQAALYRSIRSHAALAAIPVADFTDWPPSAGKADLANVHSYPRRGDPPGRQLAWDWALVHAADADKRSFVVTELGFPTRSGGLEGRAVDESTQASRLLESLAEGIRLGASRLYIYELFDERSQSQDPEMNYGLFFANGRPKPAAVVLARLQTLLAEADAGSQALSQDPLATPSAGAERSVSILGRGGRTLIVSWPGRGGAQSWTLRLRRLQRVDEIELLTGRSTPMGCRSQIAGDAAPRLRIWRLSACD